MPLINGCKYSCEPCIRGHRATSCAHTDRILLEVRKPGRPLETCGHEFATCNCGKITELLSMGTALPIPGFEQTSQNTNSALVLPAPPSISTRPRPKERARGHRGISKKSKRKKGDSPTMSPSTNRSSREPPAMFEGPEPNPQYAHPPYAYQDQVYSGGDPNASAQSSFSQFSAPSYQTMQSPAPAPQTFGPYQTGNKPNNQSVYQMTYSPPQQGSYADGYSSRVEDLATTRYEPPDYTGSGQPHVQPQYTVPKQESDWRADSEG